MGQLQRTARGFRDGQQFLNGGVLADGRTRGAVILGANFALGTELLNQPLDHIIVLSMGGQHQTGLGNFLHTDVDLIVVGERQADKFLLTALGGLVQKGLIGNNALLGYFCDLLGILTAGGAIESVVHHGTALNSHLLAVVQDRLVVLGRRGDGGVQNGGAAACGGSLGLSVEGTALGVARVTDMDVDVNIAVYWLWMKRGTLNP